MSAERHNMNAQIGLKVKKGNTVGTIAGPAKLFGKPAVKVTVQVPKSYQDFSTGKVSYWTADETMVWAIGTFAPVE